MSLALKKEVKVCESHFVHFYREERFLSGALLEYMKVGVEKGEGLIIIATEAHILEICKSLPAKIISEARFVDANWLLNIITPKGILNPCIFNEQISLLINEMRALYKKNRIFVELVDLLSETNRSEAAIDLEFYWNQYLVGQSDLIVMCSYNLRNLSQEDYRKILKSHSFSSGNEDENYSMDSLCKKISALEMNNCELKLFLRQNREVKDLKKRVVHSLKLSDIGEITAGLSHELLNPLAIIGSYSQMMSLAIKDDEFASKEFLEAQLNGINSTVNRMATLLKNVLKYSSNGCSKKDFLIDETVADAVEMMRPILRPHNISVELFIPPEKIFMHGDSGQILQVIFNLLTNARDAIMEARGKNGGIIHISIEAVDKDRFQVVLEDNGKGIDKIILESIWKPFFTTKPTEKGTGLGLSIVQKIIHDNGGSIHCDSVLNRGTKFNISLPRVFLN